MTWNSTGEQKKNCSLVIIYYTLSLPNSDPPIHEEVRVKNICMEWTKMRPIFLCHTYNALRRHDKQKYLQLLSQTESYFYLLH